jgi:hypothetical protein
VAEEAAIRQDGADVVVVIDALGHHVGRRSGDAWTGSASDKAKEPGQQEQGRKAEWRHGRRILGHGGGKAGVAVSIAGRRGRRNCGRICAGGKRVEERLARRLRGSRILHAEDIKGTATEKNVDLLNGQVRRRRR